MSRLAKVLAGDWETTETMEKGEFFPNAGERRGSVHASLAAGRTTLIYEVHSDGSAGKLDGMSVIWWDRDAKSYRFFICFNNPEHPCKMRGNAHWEGDLFVNDYDEMVKGKKTARRDSFSFTSISHTVLAAMKANGRWQTLITTKAIRRFDADCRSEQAAFEQDPHKLLELVREINRSIVSWKLEEKQKQLLLTRQAAYSKRTPAWQGDHSRPFVIEDESFGSEPNGAIGLLTSHLPLILRRLNLKLASDNGQVGPQFGPQIRASNVR